MSDRTTEIREALGKWALANEKRTESQAFDWLLKNDPVVVTRIWEAARAYLVAARHWDAFPSDEDVEAAAQVLAERREAGVQWGNWSERERTDYREQARAALLAVKARETDQ